MIMSAWPDGLQPVLGYILNGAATLLLALMAYMARLLLRHAVATYDKVEHLDNCMDKTQDIIREHLDEATRRDERLSAVEKDLIYIKGRLGLPIEAPLTVPEVIA